MEKPSETSQSTKISFGMGRKSQPSMVANIKRGAGMASYSKSPMPSMKHDEQVGRADRARSRTDPGTATTRAPAFLPPSAATPQPNSSWASRLPRRNKYPQSNRSDSDAPEEHPYDAQGGEIIGS